ncbi:MAG: hypothetical protein K2H17_10605 [Duncaniella sp.]|uniref:hypothetical protein n=1 Tax=Duncaniella sp. TaxID=2518496 RepID=UPI0023C6E3AA|nr:hypothetical protein [Duncaniella sp.]MDE5989831.1 hypothetical protein [Duncaniella sp.]
MNKYNFEPIGKKMPYRVPDDFFADVEKRIAADALEQRRRSVRRIFWRGIAAAAVLVLLFMATRPGLFRHRTDFTDVAQAFDDLSDADRSYLLETYQDDIFITNND